MKENNPEQKDHKLLSGCLKTNPNSRKVSFQRKVIPVVVKLLTTGQLRVIQKEHTSLQVEAKLVKSILWLNRPLLHGHGTGKKSLWIWYVVTVYEQSLKWNSEIILVIKMSKSKLTQFFFSWNKGT